MPCIIYRVSYENELRGKFCSLLGAFAGFPSGSKELKKKKKKGKHDQTLSVTADCLRQKERMGRRWEGWDRQNL